MAEAAVAEKLVIVPEASVSIGRIEHYAHSLGTWEQLGGLAVRNQLASPEGQAIERLAYDDSKDAIIENLKTDAEFRSKLDVNSPKTYRIINGQTCSADGTPVVELIGRGIEVSARAAQTDPSFGEQYKIQNERDQLDLANAQAVDALPVGRARFVVSMEPKTQLADESTPELANKSIQKFWEGLGYRKGIVYLQWYHKVDAYTLKAGVLSVDLSDEANWRAVFKKHGVEIPADATPNSWIQHAIEVDLEPDVAQAYAEHVREDFYQQAGSTHRRQSVTEYVEAHEPFIKSMFTTYNRSLAVATHTGEKTATLDGFARSLLQRSESLNAEVRRQLVRIVNRSAFDDNDARLMEGAIRYAVVEELRKGLKDFTRVLRPDENPAARLPLVNINYGGFTPEMMHQRLALNVEAGAIANRSYGGCTTTFEPGVSKAGKEFEDMFNLQDVFGGQTQSQEEARAEEAEFRECDYVSKKCPVCDEKNVVTHDRHDAITGACGCVYDKKIGKVVKKRGEII
jgi:hypothetical protein